MLLRHVDGQPKVCQLEYPITIKQDVLRLDISAG